MRSDLNSTVHDARINDLMVCKRVHTFEQLLEGYVKLFTGLCDFDVIDGGAGSGSTGRSILKYLNLERKVYAYEPFQGNHRFFDPTDERLVLIKKALSDNKKTMTLNVGSVVGEQSTGRWAGHKGYSSLGLLTTNGGPGSAGHSVSCVPGDLIDEEYQCNKNIGFIKLDLQGGELGALKGLENTLPTTKLLWIEFGVGAQDVIIDFLLRRNYTLFDTAYLMMGKRDESFTDFDFIEECDLSTGRKAWFGFRNRRWGDYMVEQRRMRNMYGLSQTDLVCVNNTYLDEFLNMVQYIVPATIQSNESTRV